MLKKSKEREFNTVEEVFETYIPNYKHSCDQEIAINETDVGSQLASQLLKNFENKLDKNLAKLNQKNN